MQILLQLCKVELDLKVHLLRWYKTHLGPSESLLHLSLSSRY